MNMFSRILFVFFIVLFTGDNIITSMPLAPAPVALPPLPTPPPAQLAPVSLPALPTAPAQPISMLPLQPIAIAPAPMPAAQPMQMLPSQPAPMYTAQPSTASRPAPIVPTYGQFPQAPQFPNTTSGTTALSYKQELDKVTADIDSINALKSRLKSQLADLDTKLGQAQEQLAATKKLSFELLSKEDETEAGKVLESMKQNLATMQQTQKAIDTTTVQEFNNTVASIRNLMTSVQTQLQSLESKSNALKTAPNATPATTPFGTASGPVGIQGAAPSALLATKIADQPRVEKTLIHKFFNTIADIVTGSITMIASFLSSIKETIIPTQPTIDELEKMRALEEAKKKIVLPAAPTTQIPAAPSFAEATKNRQSITAPALTNAMQAFPAPQGPVGSPAFVDQVKANIVAIDQVVKKLDDQRVSVKQMVQDIKKQAKGLAQRIDQNPELKERTSEKLTFNGNHNSKWKKTAESWFEKFLNALDTGIEVLSTAYNKIVQAGKKAWQSTAEPTTKNQAGASASRMPLSK